MDERETLRSWPPSLTQTFWSTGSTAVSRKKQKVATDILRRGIEDDSIRVPHQAILEFVAASHVRYVAIPSSNKAMHSGKRRSLLRSLRLFIQNEAILRNAITIVVVRRL